MLNESTPLDFYFFFNFDYSFNKDFKNVSSIELIRIFPFGLHESLEKFIKSQNIFFNFDWFIRISYSIVIFKL